MSSHKNYAHEEVAVILAVCCTGVFIIRLALPYFSSLTSWLSETVPNECTPLLNRERVLALNNQKFNAETPVELESFFKVTRIMLEDLALLGLTLSVGDSLDLAVLRKHYRNKLRDSHPDKTHTDTSDYFIAVRSALKRILEAIAEKPPLVAFAISELCEIFTAKNSAMQAMLSQELSQWKQLREAYKILLNSHEQKQEIVIVKQQACLEQEKKYGQAIDDLTERVEQLADEKLARYRVMDALEAGQLSHNAAERLFQAADYFGGFTKLPYYKQNPCALFGRRLNEKNNNVCYNPRNSVAEFN